MSSSCSMSRTDELTSPAWMRPPVWFTSSAAMLAAFSPLLICHGQHTHTHTHTDTHTHTHTHIVTHLKSPYCPLWRGQMCGCDFCTRLQTHKHTHTLSCAIYILPLSLSLSRSLSLALSLSRSLSLALSLSRSL